MEKLRIGILVDSEKIPAWSWEMLRVIQQEGFATIVLVIKNSAPKPSGKPSPFLYRLYRWIDRKLFPIGNDAFVRKSISEVPGLRASIISVDPIQKKFTDYFNQDDLRKVSSYRLDIVLRLGFRIIKGDILTIPKYGIWSFHHGDNRVNRGGPACFWEVFLPREETGSVLQVLSEKLDNGKIIYRSWSRTDPLSVNRNANKVYWKSLFFVPRQIRFLACFGEQAWLHQVEKNQDEPYHYSNPMYTPPGNLMMSRLLLNFMIRTISRKLTEVMRYEKWRIYIGKRSASYLPDMDRLLPIISPSEKYYADPFVYERNGITAIFFENYDLKKRKGCISAGIWREGELKEVNDIINEAYHLSYPGLFADQGSLYLIPEAAASSKLTLYRCDSFPFHWSRLMILMDDVKGYDPTLYFYQGYYWIFMNQKPHAEASSFDELYLYYAESLFSNKWNPHPLNPIVSDVKSSRCAGAVFVFENNLYRPAQDSAKRYGHRIKYQKIVKWNKDQYEEETVEMLETWKPNQVGTHTINFSENWVVVDVQLK